MNIEKVESLYTTDCIRTFTGIYMNVFEPTFEMIDIRDIAHSLSNQPRFGGHLPVSYSVARHSLNCAYLIKDDNLKLDALLHDASEAYLMDIPKPIKNRLANYKEIEDRLMRFISVKYRFEYPLHKKVKRIDELMLENEWECLMLKNKSYLFEDKDVANTEKEFLQMFKYFKKLKK